MSIEYLNRVFAIKLTGAKKAVLIAIADRSNKGGYCYPSMDDIAFRSGCSKRSAIRSVNELEKLGFFSVVRETGKPNKYLFLPERLSTTCDTVSPEKDTHRDDTMSLPPDTVSPHRCHGVTQTIKNHQLTKKKCARGKQNQGVVTNAQAYKTYQPEKTPKVNRQIIGNNLKHIRDLLTHAGGMQ